MYYHYHPHFAVEEQRPREAEPPAQGHVANKWWRQVRTQVDRLSGLPDKRTPIKDRFPTESSADPHPDQNTCWAQARPPQAGGRNSPRREGREGQGRGGQRAGEQAGEKGGWSEGIH